MEHRPLGRTGVSVSKLCLGTMMFGAWGNPDHDDSIRIIHAALDAGINFLDTADVYSAGESEEIVAKALPAAGATTSCSRPRSASRWATTQTAAAPRAAGSSRAVEDSLRRRRPTGSTSTRSTAPTPTPTSRRRSAAHGPRPAGQGPLRRLLHLPRRRSSRPSGRRATGACSARDRAAARTRSSSAGSRPTSCPRAPATAWA